MFTGIIEEVGEIAGREDGDAFVRVRVRAPRTAAGLTTGASVATSGVCLTAREIAAGGFTADLSRETLQRTTFGAARTGDRVNLERALAAGQPLGGHLVQGHADGVGEILRLDRGADGWVLQVAYDPAFASRLVWKGSVAVDGISLTVADLSADAFTVAIIPHTWEQTNLQFRRPGERVNLEFDVVAKYVEKMLAPYLDQIHDKLQLKPSSH